jgi:lysozyme
MKYTAYDLTKQFEGCKLVAYLDSGGVPTIGYGHIKGVKMGDKITQSQADAWLAEDMKSAENDVNRLVKIPLTQNQYDACVDFVFNLGGTNFAKSTLLKLINEGKLKESANEFPKWNKCAGKELAGLTRRRLAEQALFLKG